METGLALNGLHKWTGAWPPVVHGSLLSFRTEFGAQTEVVVLPDSGPHALLRASMGDEWSDQEKFQNVKTYHYLINIRKLVSSSLSSCVCLIYGS
jgi:hypothetical protein